MKIKFNALCTHILLSIDIPNIQQLDVITKLFDVSNTTRI